MISLSKTPATGSTGSVGLWCLFVEPKISPCWGGRRPLCSMKEGIVYPPEWAYDFDTRRSAWHSLATQGIAWKIDSLLDASLRAELEKWFCYSSFCFSRPYLFFVPLSWLASLHLSFCIYFFCGEFPLINSQDEMEHIFRHLVALFFLFGRSCSSCFSHGKGLKTIRSPDMIYWAISPVSDSCFCGAPNLSDFPRR